MKILLLKIFTNNPVVHNPDTGIGVDAKVLPDVGVLIVAAVVGGGLGILPCNPVVPDCCGSELPSAVV